jgi:type VI secretion system protein VasD
MQEEIMKSPLWLIRTASIIILLWVTGCASTPKPAVIQVLLDVQPNVNPDSRGRSSPIVMRLYEIKSLAAFNTADFFSIFDRDKETLGAELLAREEFQLRPGEKRQFNRQLQLDTRYVGVIAAFRDLERSQWRAVLPVAPKKKAELLIQLDAKKITISPR